jgi:adenosylcobinamide kinase/adenosylcobinamide-phosphate guanylyltransferase
MNNRILRHKKERPPDWTTFEEPIDIAGLIKNIKNDYDSILIDCLTVWLSNIFYKGLKKEALMSGLIDALREPLADIYIVSNEIGMGIVPESPTTREFRDMAGRLNQMIASISDEVYLVVSGIPIKIKGEDYEDN